MAYQLQLTLMILQTFLIIYNHSLLEPIVFPLCKRRIWKQKTSNKQKEHISSMHKQNLKRIAKKNFALHDKTIITELRDNVSRIGSKFLCHLSKVVYSHFNYERSDKNKNEKKKLRSFDNGGAMKNTTENNGKGNKIRNYQQRI